MPIDNEAVPEFLEELQQLVSSYRTRMSVVECLGALKLLSDHVSKGCRDFDPGPSEFS